MNQSHNRSKIVAILNITPDSFSDGNEFYSSEAAIDVAREMLSAGVDVIDIGAESTRPGAVPVLPQEEIKRIEKVLFKVKTLIENTQIEISLDSRNYETLNHFIDHIDVINDVTGLKDERIVNLALKHDKKVIFMHSLSIPVKKEEIVPPNWDIIQYLQNWFDKKLQSLDSKGFKRENLIFDPGIGFGVNAQQSISILKRIHEFVLQDVKMMIGHSRKSFLSQFGEKEAKGRDSETHALTMYLVSKKVDYIRVHDFKAARRIAKLAEAVYG